MFSGYFTALITPFRNGEIDEQAFQDIVEWQIKEGIHGLVPCGTTGESPTLTPEEHNRVIELCVEAANGRVPVLAGSGSNSTEEMLFYSREAEKSGADALLIVAPYYNKPTPEGIYQHFKAISSVSDLPVIVYNIPGRSIIDIADKTMARLSELPNIVGVKDATGDLSRVPCLTRLCGENFCQMSGEDATTPGYLAMGGNGSISVTANVAPKLCAAMYNAWADGNLEVFNMLRDRLHPLHKGMFIESSPTPVKYAASQLGLCENELRLPLLPASDACRAGVDAAMNYAGLAVQEQPEDLQTAVNE